MGKLASKHDQTWEVKPSRMTKHRDFMVKHLDVMRCVVGEEAYDIHANRCVFVDMYVDALHLSKKCCCMYRDMYQKVSEKVK
jgi:hypothetical protein